MARIHDTEKDSGDFRLHINDDGTWPIEKIQCAMLADIRRELRRLNSLLHCSNFVSIPHKLEQIKRNTTKKRRAKKVVSA